MGAVGTDQLLEALVAGLVVLVEAVDGVVGRLFHEVFRVALDVVNADIEPDGLRDHVEVGHGELEGVLGGHLQVVGGLHLGFELGDLTADARPAAQFVADVGDGRAGEGLFVVVDRGRAQRDAVEFLDEALRVEDFRLQAAVVGVGAGNGVVAVAHGVDLVAPADVGRSVFAVVAVVLLHDLDGLALVRVVGHNKEVAFEAFVEVVGENLELDRRGARAFDLADGLDEVGAVLDVPGTFGGDVQFVGAVLHLEDHGAVVGLY